MNKFCIFAGARTGSSSLYELFKDAGVRIRFEPFRPNRWKGKEFEVKDVLHEIYQHSDAIKHLWDHLSVDQNQELIEFLIEKKIKVIFLTRENKFWQAISRALAYQTNMWGNREQTTEIKVEYAIKELYPVGASLIKDYIAMNELADRVFLDMLLEADSMSFHYEELYNHNLDKQLATIAELLGFLDMELTPFMVGLVVEHMGLENKVNTLDIYRKIPNWDTLREIFSIGEDEL